MFSIVLVGLVTVFLLTLCLVTETDFPISVFRFRVYYAYGLVLFLGAIARS